MKSFELEDDGIYEEFQVGQLVEVLQSTTEAFSRWLVVNGRVHRVEEVNPYSQTVLLDGWSILVDMEDIYGL